MSNEIVKVNADKIAAFSGYTSEEIAIIKNTVAKGTSDMELAYFVSVAKSVELNPFHKQIWCYKDNKDNLLIFTGRDGFLSIAQKNPAFNGIRSSEVRSMDTFKIDIANNKITHEFGLKERGNIVGAYAIVFRKNGEPTIEYAEFSVFNKGWNVWKTNPAEMIKKVAETHALKKAFGIVVQSEYDFEVKGDVVLPLQLEQKPTKIKQKDVDNDLLEQFKKEVDEYPHWEPLQGSAFGLIEKAKKAGMDEVDQALLKHYINSAITKMKGKG